MGEQKRNAKNYLTSVVYAAAGGLEVVRQSNDVCIPLRELCRSAFFVEVYCGRKEGGLRKERRCGQVAGDGESGRLKDFTRVYQVDRSNR